MCVVLQTDKTGGLQGGELLLQHGYGVCQIVLTVAILPATLYVIRKRVLDFREQTRADLRQLKEAGQDGELGSMENPVSAES